MQPVDFTWMSLGKFHSASASKGFSIVELLVVISVIGIIASLAIPNLASVSRGAHFAKNERNAQTLASLAAAARAAGCTNQWLTIDSAVGDLKEGVSVRVAGQPIDFRMSELSPVDQDGITNFLAVDTNTAMVYYTGPAAD